MDIYNGPSSASYPLSFLVFISLLRNSSQIQDCSVIELFVEFISWTQLNQQAYEVVSGNSFVPVSNGYRRSVGLTLNIPSLNMIIEPYLEIIVCSYLSFIPVYYQAVDRRHEYNNVQGFSGE